MSSGARFGSAARGHDAGRAQLTIELVALTMELDRGVKRTFRPSWIVLAPPARSSQFSREAAIAAWATTRWCWSIPSTALNARQGVPFFGVMLVWSTPHPDTWRLLCRQLINETCGPRSASRARVGEASHRGHAAN